MYKIKLLKFFLQACMGYLIFFCKIGKRQIIFTWIIVFSLMGSGCLRVDDVTYDQINPIIQDLTEPEFLQKDSVQYGVCAPLDSKDLKPPTNTIARDQKC